MEAISGQQSDTGQVAPDEVQEVRPIKKIARKAAFPSGTIGYVLEFIGEADYR
jgi:hypothetical protein